MALIDCSECGKSISDKAGVCPGCGNPMSNSESTHVSNSEPAVRPANKDESPSLAALESEISATAARSKAPYVSLVTAGLGILLVVAGVDAGGALIGLGLAAVYISWILRRVAIARARYAAALLLFSKKPHEPSLRVSALSIGREYAAISNENAKMLWLVPHLFGELSQLVERILPGTGRIVVYSEQSIQNDLQSFGAKAGSR